MKFYKLLLKQFSHCLAHGDADIGVGFGIATVVTVAATAHRNWVRVNC